MLGLGHLELGKTFNRQLTLTVLLICLSQFNYGFDNQGYSSIQSMDYFDKQFGVYNAKKKTYVLPTWWTSLFNSLIFIGLGLGVIVGSMISKRFGRRMCMFVMSLWAIVSATVTITSKSATQILVARILNYGYIGMEMAVVPIYQSEIVPRQARGFVVSTYQFMLGVGGIVINCITYGTQNIPSNASWQIPFGLFFIIPSIVAVLIWFVPESPRWLVMQDRVSEGRAALEAFRGGKFTQEEIDREFTMITSGIQYEQEKGSFAEMFKGKANRRRTLCIIGVNFFFMATGQNFTSTYGALFVKSLQNINQFKIAIINSTVSLVTVMMSMQLTDRIGRRFLLIVGGSLQVLTMFAMAAIGVVSTGTFAESSAIVAMMILFQAAWWFGWAPVVHTLSAELPSMKLRDITYRTASVTQIVTQFVVSFTIPYLLNEPYANLGAKVGFIYGSIAVLSVIYAYFCVPEARGRPLEHLDRLFEDMGIPLRKFHTVKIDADEHVLSKLDEENEPSSVHDDIASTKPGS